MDKPVSYLSLPTEGRLNELQNAEFYFQEKFIPNPAEVYQTIHDRVPWEQGEVIVYGKKFNEPRLSQIYSVRSINYSYSGRTKDTLIFPDFLETIRSNVSKYCSNLLKSDVNFDTCLCNYYRNGHDKIGMHSDKEDSLKPGAPIASISLGTERFFDVWCKDISPVQHDRYRMNLPSGSLLVMANNTQKYYTHGVPQQKTIKTGRINLTFRVTN
jgi:alkylated DNA repair dioxygenase AlkB